MVAIENVLSEHVVLREWWIPIPGCGALHVQYGNRKYRRLLALTDVRSVAGDGVKIQRIGILKGDPQLEQHGLWRDAVFPEPVIGSLWAVRDTVKGIHAK